MKKAGCLLTSVLALVLAIGVIWFLSGWWGSAQVEDDTNFIVPSGASLTSVADKLADEGLISDPRGFLLRSWLANFFCLQAPAIRRSSIHFSMAR